MSSWFCSFGYSSLFCVKVVTRLELLQVLRMAHQRITTSAESNRYTLWTLAVCSRSICPVMSLLIFSQEWEVQCDLFHSNKCYQPLLKNSVTEGMVHLISGGDRAQHSLWLMQRQGLATLWFLQWPKNKCASEGQPILPTLSYLSSCKFLSLLKSNTTPFKSVVWALKTVLKVGRFGSAHSSSAHK